MVSRDCEAAKVFVTMEMVIVMVIMVVWVVVEYKTLTYHVYIGDVNVDYVKTHRLLNWICSRCGRVYCDRRESYQCDDIGNGELREVKRRGGESKLMNSKGVFQVEE